MTTPAIAILEDDERRRDAMAAVLSRLGHSARFFTHAVEMNAWLGGNLSSVRLLSLDHDLGPNVIVDGEPFDPGTGRDVVSRLVAHAAVCPVIVHSSNPDGALGMVLELEAAGWVAIRVFPLDDLAWIADKWAARVREVLS